MSGKAAGGYFVVLFQCQNKTWDTNGDSTDQRQLDRNEWVFAAQTGKEQTQQHGVQCLCKIQGTDLKLGIGRAEEPFEGIGRGVLNIEGLPVYRDAVGGIGTPTSDNERTKMDLGTQHILAIVNGYSGQEGLREAAEMIQELLKKYTSSNGGEIIYFE